MIDESQSMFHLNDLSLFEETLKRLRPKLVIIDPIQRYIPTGKSMDKANDVRSALSPIRDLAEKYECTVLIIMHRNKGNSNGKIPSLYRALGSIDFVGTARGMLTAEQTNKGKVVYQTKNSLGVIGEPLMYEISDDGFKIIGKFRIVRAISFSSLPNILCILSCFIPSAFFNSDFIRMVEYKI